MDFEGKKQSLLTFRVGPVLCCAPSLPVRSIITPPKLTHPPGSDSSQPGIFKHGSNIVKVLDLRKKFGIDDAEQTQPGNFIITIFEKESFAFWVDQILDVFDFPSEGWGSIPAAIPRGVFTRTLLLNKKIHLYSEFEKLATIQDLGYLKHYIQQLKEQSDKKTEAKKVGTRSILKSSNKISVDKESVTSTLPSANKTMEQTTSRVATPILETSRKQTPTIKPLSKSVANKKTYKTNNTVEKRINSRPLTQHNPKLETSPVKKTAQSPTQNTVQSTAQSKVIKNTYASPAPNKKTPVIKPDESIASGLKTQDETNITKSTTYTPPHQKNTEQVTDEKSSSIGIIFLFLFICGLLGTGIYFFLPKEITTASKHDGYITEDNTKIILQSSPQEPYEDPQIVLEKNYIEEELVNSISIEEKSRDQNLAHNTTEEEPATGNKSNLTEEPSYRADISKQDNEITITLHQPISTAETDIEKDHVAEQKIESKIKEETTIEIEPLNVKKLNPPIAKEKIINEVIHTVVKGDTLWAIAKKYVNNPFLYPELARLSNIKNPHRIYPGNRVRIRFIKK